MNRKIIRKTDPGLNADGILKPFSTGSKVIPTAGMQMQVVLIAPT